MCIVRHGASAKATYRWHYGLFKNMGQGLSLLLRNISVLTISSYPEARSRSAIVNAGYIHAQLAKVVHV